MKIRIEVSLTVLFLLVFVSNSCYEPISDCLDVLATNYEVSADKECDECCTYPSLSISLSHVMNDTLDFEEDSIYQTKFNDDYQIKYLQYFISQFKLLDEDQIAHGVNDQITFNDINGNEVSTEDNYAYITSSKSSYSFGTFIAPGSYTGVRFNLGLEEIINHGDLENLSSAHALIESKDSMYIDQSEGYIFMRLNFLMDPMNLGQSFDINISGDDNLIVIELNHDFTVSMGENVSIKLQADYSKLFNNLDLDSLSGDDIKENIVNFITSSFSILE